MSERFACKREIDRDEYYGHEDKLRYAVWRAKEIAKEEVFLQLAEKCKPGEAFHVFRYEIRQYRERMNKDLEIIEARLEIDKAVTRSLPAIVYPKQEIALYRAERPQPEPSKPKHDPLDAEEKEIILRRRKAKADAEKLKTRRQWIPWGHRRPIAKDEEPQIGKLIRVPCNFSEFFQMVADLAFRKNDRDPFWASRNQWVWWILEKISPLTSNEADTRKVWFE